MKTPLVGVSLTRISLYASTITGTPTCVARYNASGDTLSFVVRPVTDASALKLIAGAANGALGGDPAMRLNSTTAGLIMRDIIIYIDDATRTVRAWLLPGNTLQQLPASRPMGTQMMCMQRMSC